MAEEKKVEKKAATAEKSTKQPVRLYTKAVFTGFTRSLAKQDSNHAILKLDGVKSRPDTAFYMGKRVAFVYRAKNPKPFTKPNKSRFRVIWGVIQRPHGRSGAVRAGFRTNLPPRAMGSTLRVMLYPSRV